MLLGGLWALALLIALPREPMPPTSRHRAAADQQASSASALLFPVPGGSRQLLEDGFEERRGERRHQAVDIPAPRGSEALAVSDGTLERLSNSELGGLGLYLRDRAHGRCYYYAHLDGYAPELEEGQPVTRGQLLGYVGTTGNAPESAPHLHLAVRAVGPDQACAEGEPIDPHALLEPQP
jgi:murein DD-endopeptidase MepM/ murein hydrolase activator NlpD